MRVAEHLRSLDPPWAFLTVLASDQDARAKLVGPAGFVSRVADGRRCRTKPEFLAELARVLEHPGGTISNWDALEEVLADLDWLPAAGYVVGLSHAEELLAESPDDYETFLLIVDAVGREWSAPREGEWPRPAIPFHVVLTVPADRERARQDWRVPILEA